MTGRTLTLATLAGKTGQGVRVAVVDSGIHAAHPHVGGIAGGVSIDREGRHGDDTSDRLGHGTAVAAAIREKAPAAALIAIKIFERTLETTGVALVEAIRWAAREGATVINLSLGTVNPAHEHPLGDAVREAGRAGAVVVAAAPVAGSRWLPGAIPGVIAVELDWESPRDAVRAVSRDQQWRIIASGYPRPIPGVSPEQNFKGHSFAVANASGFLALVLEGHAGAPPGRILDEFLAGVRNWV